MRVPLLATALSCGARSEIAGQVVPAKVDAAADDGVADAVDAAPKGWCGGVSCDWQTEYCHADGVGSPFFAYGKCVALPPQCTVDKTCTCLAGALSDGGAACVGCKDIDGGLVEGCWEP